MQISLLAWLTFSSVLLCAMAIPGPGVLATISRSLSFGRQKANWFVLGACLGDLVFLWVALLGLSSLISASFGLFSALAFVMGCYFSLVGLRGFTSKNTLDSMKPTIGATQNAHTGVLFAEGFLLTISNPKVALFYVGLLPSLLNVAVMTRNDFILVSIITPVLLFVVLSTYAAVADRARLLISNNKWAARLKNASAFTMLVLGLLLIFKSGAIQSLIWTVLR